MPSDSNKGADLLTVVFGTTLIVWSLLYLAAFPAGFVPPWVAAGLVVICLFGAGFVLGRSAGRTWRGGLGAGLGIGLVALLVLASLLGGAASEDITRGLAWIGGFIAFACVLGAGGAALGHAPSPAPANWTARFCVVTGVTVLAMLIAGGLVTGLEAGLAVEGWLNAEGHFLPLFPLDLMQRDVGTFVEHAHRLWGLLVGLSTIVLAVHLWRAETRGWVRAGAIGVVLIVVLQGVLGGTRVTEESVALGIVHGVVAHVVLASLAVIAAAVSTSWRSAEPAVRTPSAGTERTLSALLVAAVLVQVTIGTFFRHLQPEPGTPHTALIGLLHGHSFGWSLVVVVLVLLCGVRAWGRYREETSLHRGGLVIVHILILQVLLGISAFIVVPKGARPEGETITAIEVAITSAHQVVGASLLATAACLAAWIRRRLA
jgi:cytochrome c oxidase assembly protein subunit 15